MAEECLNLTSLTIFWTGSRSLPCHSSFSRLVSSKRTIAHDRIVEKHTAAILSHSLHQFLIFTIVALLAISALPRPAYSAAIVARSVPYSRNPHPQLEGQKRARLFPFQCAAHFIYLYVPADPAPAVTRAHFWWCRTSESHCCWLLPRVATVNRLPLIYPYHDWYHHRPYTTPTSRQ